MSDILLSVVIPTYNRLKLLKESINIIVPQLRDNVELVILDNDSPVDPSVDLQDIIDANPSVRIRLVRNRFNIGTVPNILRSFEVASGKWVLTLGDDDDLINNGIDIILEVISNHSDAEFLHFSTTEWHKNNERPTSFDTYGASGFIHGFDSGGAVNFMSVSVWRKEFAYKNALEAYRFSYSMSPTYVMLIKGLGLDKKCHFSNQVIIENATKVDASGRWAYREFCLGFNLILELPMTPKERGVLMTKMRPWVTPEFLTLQLLVSSNADHVKRQDYRLCYFKLAPYLSWFDRLRFKVLGLLFLFPALGKTTAVEAVKLSNRLGFTSLHVSEFGNR